MPYNNIIPNNYQNMYRQPPRRPGGPGRPGPGPRPNTNSYNGGFLLPFALGFAASPLLYGATRPRPYYYNPYPYPYYPYY